MLHGEGGYHILLAHKIQTAGQVVPHRRRFQKYNNSLFAVVIGPIAFLSKVQYVVKLP
jgi:hypothetical protein